MPVSPSSTRGSRETRRSLATRRPPPRSTSRRRRRRSPSVRRTCRPRPGTHRPLRRTTGRRSRLLSRDPVRRGRADLKRYDMHRNRSFVLATLLALAALPAFGGSVEVKLKLPQRARLDLQGRKSIAVVPFLVVSQEGAEKIKGRNIDVQKEFDRYLVK